MQSVGHSHWNYFVAVSPINTKVGIEGENCSEKMDLRESNQTSIRKGHRPIAVSVHERPNILVMLFQGKPDPNYASLQQCKHRVSFLSISLQEECRLGQDRLAGQERGSELFPQCHSPLMMTRARGEKTHQWARIE
jgi:hypothetical protein